MKANKSIRAAVGAVCLLVTVGCGADLASTGPTSSDTSANAESVTKAAQIIATPENRSGSNGAFEVVASAAKIANADDTKPRSRKFRFDYGLKLKALPKGEKVQVWQPVPPSNDYQTVVELERMLPADPTVAEEPKYGNRIMYFETKAPDSGELEFVVSYLVQRSEVRALTSKEKGVALDEDERKVFLAANAKVPIDGRPLELLKGVTLPKGAVNLGRTLYECVDEHMRYDKSNPGYGHGDVLWACDSRFGNCTDFHSLFIALARSQGLPARFEIGFPLPPERGEGTIGGYHCWAYFFVKDHGWVPTDISEADKHPELKDYYFGSLSENRVVLTTGRDLELVPKQAGPPLNFFVYPYVEVDETLWPKEKLQERFRFEDL